jgi:hypothetical protein
MAVVVVMGVINLGRMDRVIAIDISVAAKVLEYLGARETCDESADEREKYDGLIHGFLRQPFMRLISSTAMEPRLRK